MAESNQLNHAWLAFLANPHHDGTTQQIDDFLQAYATDNQVFNQKKAVVHQARQKEDEVWLRSQRDPAVERLEAADKKQDAYISATRHIIQAHAGLPDEETTKAEEKRLASMGDRYVCKLPEASAAKQLSEHQNQKMAPMGKRPASCVVVVLDRQTFEVPLRKELGNLRKNIVTRMHTCSIFDLGAKVRISKVRQGFQTLCNCA